MPRIPFLPAALCSFVLLAACRSAHITTNPAVARDHRALPDPFVDQTLRTEMEHGAAKLIEEKSTVTCDALSAQLDRTSCEATLPSPHSSTLSLPDLYQAAAPSVLVIGAAYHCDKCGRYHFAFTASAIALTEGGLCATNYHVFDKNEDTQHMVVADAWGEVYAVKQVLAASKQNDAAVFQVDLGDARLDPLPLKAASPVGSAIAVLSHPSDHFYSFYPGNISRRSWRYRGMNGDMRGLSAPDDHDSDDGPTMDITKLTHTLEVTADYGVGSSGGPVLDMSGNVVGMVSNTSALFAEQGRPRTLQMSFHHCVPAESILALIHAPADKH